MIILNTSDYHSGRTVALLPKDARLSRHLEISPNSIQCIIQEQYAATLRRVANLRAWDELVAVINGDCIEGNHHDTRQIHTPAQLSQVDIFRDIWDETNAAIQPDRTYMVAGTDTHVGEWEHVIGEHVRAEPYGATGYIHPVLTRTVAGIPIWWAHHGPNPGRGSNQGNALRAKLKELVVDTIASGGKPPRVVVYGHTHTPTHETVTLGNYTVDGFILPSWKAKDDYVYKKMPFALNSVGALLLDINGRFPGGKLENGWWEWSCLQVTQERQGKL